MNVQTKYHHVIECKQENILRFENGIPGFPDEKEFVILTLPDNEVFSILQSVRTVEVAFVITNPFSFFKDYEFKLDDPTVEQLQLKDEKNVQVFSILTVHNPFDKSTINLQAPVIINVENKFAKQVILNENKYKTKHPIFHQISEKVKG